MLLGAFFCPRPGKKTGLSATIPCAAADQGRRIKNQNFYRKVKKVE
jgi:hypothetical protein